MTSRIVLLHATPVAMLPIQTAFAKNWADAETINLLDDGLSIDRAREDTLSSAMIDRFVRFGLYARDMQADGILITCSAFGPAIEKLANEVSIPVLKPNEAMFEAAIQSGRNIGMLATFAPAVETMTDEFNEYVARVGSDATLRTIIVADAIDLLKKGDVESHNRLVAQRAPELADCDAIMLAHFSTSRAADAVRAVVRTPVLTAPDAAVERMHAMVSSARL
jgi:Asp/Glu/hydantoin racemase